MIYAMTRDVSALLTERKYPVRVEYGPEQTARVAPHSVIVIERDKQADETIEAAHGLNRNAKKVLARYLPCVAKIYACSTQEGARVNEHEHECDRFVDALLGALYRWAKEAQAEVKIKGARFLPDAESVDVATWPGVVYQLTFAVGRGVFVRDYTGAGAAELAPAGVRGRVEVRRTGSAEPPEIVEIG